MKVKITKVAATDNPQCITPQINTYNMGCNNGDVSLPVEYYLEGDLIGQIVVNASVRVIRTSRNGVECLGMFTTSPVVSVSEIGFTTQNSVYLVEYL